jgi:hypothetical protein
MIYFIRSRDGGPIKIGTTIRLSQRLKSLADEHGKDLEVLAIAEGSYTRESELHRQFSHLRAFGEWFEPGDDLVGFIVAEGKPWDGSDEAPAATTAKIDAEVAYRARIAAAMRDCPLAEYLSEIVVERANLDIDEWTRKEAVKKPKR